MFRVPFFTLFTPFFGIGNVDLGNFMVTGIRAVHGAAWATHNEEEV